MRALVATGLALAVTASACAPRPLGEVQAAPTAVAPISTAVARVAAATRRRVVSRPAPVTAPAPAAVVPAPTPAVPPPRPVISGLLDGMLPDDDSVYGLVVEDLASAARVSINEDQVLPSASLYKLGVAWLAMRAVDAGELSLDSSIDIEDEDTIEPEPDGGYGAGDTPSLRDALESMLSLSSNSAAHALLRILGRDTFDQEMDRIGLSQTRVPVDSLAVTSAADIAHLMRLLVTSPELSTASRSILQQYMANVAPPDALHEALPESVGILQKTGNLPDASNVAALLESSRGSVILVVLDSGVDPGEARAVIAQTALAAYTALLQ